MKIVSLKITTFDIFSRIKLARYYSEEGNEIVVRRSDRMT